MSVVVQDGESWAQQNALLTLHAESQDDIPTPSAGNSCSNVFFLRTFNRTGARKRVLPLTSERNQSTNPLMKRTPLNNVILPASLPPRRSQRLPALLCTSPIDSWD
jgi:hypothetical protein